MLEEMIAVARCGKKFGLALCEAEQEPRKSVASRVRALSDKPVDANLRNGKAGMLERASRLVSTFRGSTNSLTSRSLLKLLQRISSAAKDGGQLLSLAPVCFSLVWGSGAALLAQAVAPVSGLYAQERLHLGMELGLSPCAAFDR